MSKGPVEFRLALKSKPLRAIDDWVISYVEQAVSLELNAIVEALQKSTDAEAISAIVSALSFRRETNPSLQQVVKRLARGEGWDIQDIARLQALFALPRLCPEDDSTKQILSEAYRSDNRVIRDAALVAAQTYFGVPSLEIQWGDGESELSERVDPRVLAWMCQ
jgi:hypothetical protein